MPASTPQAAGEDSGRVIVLGDNTQSGVYLLRIAVHEALAVAFGRFWRGKVIDVPPGEYVYVGSAMAARGAVRKRLAEQNIGTMIYYPVPVHKLPIYAHRDAHLPHAEQATAEVLSLPMWPYLSVEKQHRVVSVLKDALAAQDSG